MPITQSQIDALQSTVATLGTQVNALVADGNPLPPVNPTVTLAANPQSVVAGSQSTLAWTSTDAVGGVNIDQGVGSVGASGSLPVSPAATTTYTATATGAPTTTPATAQATVTVTAVVPPTGGILSTLLPGRVRDLGPYANPAVAGGPQISDDSGIFAYNGAIYIGPAGGHGANLETDVRRCDFVTAAGWTSLYPSLAYADLTVANLELAYGRFNVPGRLPHPACRHSYLMDAVVGTKHIVMQAKGMPWGINGLAEPNWGGRICWHDLVTNPEAWTWSQIPDASVPWFQGGAAWGDPQSGKVLVVSTDRAASLWMFIYLYDPATDSLAPHSLYPAAGPSGHVIGQGPAVAYVPRQDLLYIMQGRTGETWKFAFNRANPMASVLTKLTVVGAPSQAWDTVPGSLHRAPSAMGYDDTNEIIGGFIGGGIFNYFDVPDPGAPVVWQQKQMLLEAGGNASMTQAVECLKFENVSKCFGFLTSPPPEGTARTIAYRFAR